MSPEAIQRLAESPDFKELVDYIKSELDALTSIESLKVEGKDPIVVAIQVSGRQYAQKTLRKIFNELIVMEKRAIIPDAKEFVVEVP